MTLVLAQILCDACGADGWTRVPLLALGRPLQCACCGNMSASPKPGATIHLLPVGSEAEYEWYADFPEALLQDQRVPCR